MDRKFAGILLGTLALILVALGEPSRAASRKSPRTMPDLGSAKATETNSLLDTLAGREQEAIPPVTRPSFAAGATANAAAPGTAAVPPERRSREILARIDAPVERGWIARYVALDYESGFRISSAASYGNHRFELRLRGPVYETPLRARNYGLILELEF